MSKLIDRIKKVGQADMAPMGFGFTGAARVKNPAMLVIAEIPSANAKAAQEAISAGADAILLGSAGGDRKQVLSAAGDVPVGVTVAGTAAVGEGVDFVLIADLEVPASVLHLDAPAKFLELGTDWTDSQARGVEGLPVDGVLVRVHGPLTVESWLNCLRLGGIARKTFVAAVDGTLDADTMRSLRDLGARAVVVPGKSVADVRALIEALPAPKRDRDREGIFATLPRAAAAHADDDDNE